MHQIAQQGASLIEILVTVLIVSIGLLGLAALQVNSMRYNHDAYMRSIALTQAQAMADRIRANPAAADLGSYNNITAIGSDVDCSSSCTPQQMAQHDIFAWNSSQACRAAPDALRPS